MVDSERENGSSPTPPPQKVEVKKYGVMNPISYAGPSEANVHRNALLEKLLMDSGTYESAEETARREEVLSRLDQGTLVWLQLEFIFNCGIEFDHIKCYRWHLISSSNILDVLHLLNTPELFTSG